jgi:hypothetical protein
MKVGKARKAAQVPYPYGKWVKEREDDVKNEL